MVLGGENVVYLKLKSAFYSMIYTSKSEFRQPCGTPLAGQLSM